MIEATRRWFRRNRTNLVVGAGVITAGYLAGQYVLGKIQEARQRMSEDRVAKDNLRRRFQQNQEDCTYTVLALLPTIREEIIGALPVEQITEELQQQRQERLRRSGQSEAASTEYPSVPPSVADEDGSKSMSSSSYVHASRMGESTLDGSQAPRSRKSKAHLWQEMKINSITRALTLLYTLSLLTLLTRIQLNLLGRRTYLSSVVALANPPAAQQSSTISLENKDDDNYDVYGNDFETNRKYLTFSWWLLHRGSKQIMERVMVAVKEVFGQVNIKEDLTLEQLADLIMQVRKKVEGATEEERSQMKWLTYLLPPREEETMVVREAGMASDDSEDFASPEARHTEDPMSSQSGSETISGSLRRLLDETADLIDSPTFSQVLTRLLDAAYSHLVDFRLATEAYKRTGLIAPGSDVQGMSAYAESRITEVTDVEKVKLAHILPVFCKQAHAIATGSGELDTLASVAGQQGVGLGNEYLTAIDQVHDLEAFAAVIYSSNFDYEVAENNSTSASTELVPAVVTPHIPPVTTSFAAPAQQTSQVSETEPSAVADVGLGAQEETDAPPAYTAGEKAAPSGAEEKPTEGKFETAWQKALAEEDGKKEEKDDDAPVPVQDDE